MLYLYESTKFISLRPLASVTLVLCSSIAWKEASWVNVPSLSVSRHGRVTPLLDCLLPTTLAVRRKCLICSLVRVASSAAQTTCEQIKQTNAAIMSLGHC